MGRGACAVLWGLGHAFILLASVSPGTYASPSGLRTYSHSLACSELSSLHLVSAAHPSDSPEAAERSGAACPGPLEQDKPSCMRLS